MANVKLPGSVLFDKNKAVHTATQNDDVILAQEFKKHFSNASCKHGI